ncbi:MAG TPA: GNAT family N-acetyltransferase [Xanthobacteraceae bacterium]|nr:GNAT family N-acetyltransferase [Xanthobacteraceae bacterium]
MAPVRAAAPNDAARLREIAQAAYAKYVPRIGREPMPMSADYGAEIAAGRVTVIEIGGAVAGYIVAWAEPDAYYIHNVAVDPVRQGLGLGRTLIDAAVQAARRHGLGAIRLYTNAAMHENLALYARIGFAETRRAREDGFERVFMRWDLPAE